MHVDDHPLEYHRPYCPDAPRGCTGCATTTGPGGLCCSWEEDGLDENSFDTELIPAVTAFTVAWPACFMVAPTLAGLLTQSGMGFWSNRLENSFVKWLQFRVSTLYDRAGNSSSSWCTRALICVLVEMTCPSTSVCLYLARPPANCGGSSRGCCVHTPVPGMSPPPNAYCNKETREER